MTLKSQRRVPIVEAEEAVKASRSRRVRLTTVNWTSVTQIGVRPNPQVHCNIYESTLPDLVRWLRETAHVAEDIVEIEAIG